METLIIINDYILKPLLWMVSGFCFLLLILALPNFIYHEYKKIFKDKCPYCKGDGHIWKSDNAYGTIPMICNECKVNPLSRKNFPNETRRDL